MGSTTFVTLLNTGYVGAACCLWGQWALLLWNSTMPTLPIHDVNALETMHGDAFIITISSIQLEILLFIKIFYWIEKKLFIAIVLLELIVNIKFGFQEISHADQARIFYWVLIMFAGSFVGLVVCYLSGSIKQKIAPLKYSNFDASGIWS